MQYRFEMIFLSNVGRTLSRKVLRVLEEMGHLLYSGFIAGAAQTNLENPIAYGFYHWAFQLILNPIRDWNQFSCCVSDIDIGSN